MVLQKKISILFPFCLSMPIVMLPTEATLQLCFCKLWLRPHHNKEWTGQGLHRGNPIVFDLFVQASCVLTCNSSILAANLWTASTWQACNWRKQPAKFCSVLIYKDKGTGLILQVRGYAQKGTSTNASHSPFRKSLHWRAQGPCSLTALTNIAKSNQLNIQKSRGNTPYAKTDPAWT